MLRNTNRSRQPVVLAAQFSDLRDAITNAVCRRIVLVANYLRNGHQRACRFD